MEKGSCVLSPVSSPSTKSLFLRIHAFIAEMGLKLGSRVVDGKDTCPNLQQAHGDHQNDEY